MKLVFATHNSHKIAEVQRMLSADMTILSLSDIGCPDIPETGLTLEENALIKARYVKQHFGYDVFSDDSGLEVEALGGMPGVYSARYAGDAKDSWQNIQLLLQNMQGKQCRKAQFRTVIALIIGQSEYLFQGSVQGQIIQEPMGEGGFGYDPIFQPDGYNCTFAQMSHQQKNAISHRGDAVAKLVQFLKQ